jgi:hypothetical protein
VWCFGPGCESFWQGYTDCGEASYGIFETLDELENGLYLSQHERCYRGLDVSPECDAVNVYFHGCECDDDPDNRENSYVLWLEDDCYCGSTEQTVPDFGPDHERWGDCHGALIRGTSCSFDGSSNKVWAGMTVAGAVCRVDAVRFEFVGWHLPGGQRASTRALRTGASSCE